MGYFYCDAGEAENSFTLIGFHAIIGAPHELFRSPLMGVVALTVDMMSQKMLTTYENVRQEDEQS